MQSIEVQGKNVDEAIAKALEELQVSQDEVEVEVLEKESAGFFGIGGKQAKVKVTVVDTPAEVENNAYTNDFVAEAEADADNTQEDYETEELEDYENNETASETTRAKDEEFMSRIQAAADAVEEFLNKLLVQFSLADVDYVTVTVEDSRIVASIDGDDCGILIGRRGETLKSIQYICSLIANKTARTRVRFLLDAGGYKSKHREKIRNLAIRTANRAIETQQAFELTPMSATDRRIVYEALNDFEGIVTYSEGKEPRRYVVIDLAFDDDYDTVAE